jgi:hypothetical protein
LQAYLLSLSKDALESELHYLHTILEAVETVHYYKYPHLALSKEASRSEIHYLRALLATVEAVYSYKYPQEEQKPHQAETLLQHPEEAMSDLQTFLLDDLHKAGTVTVRQFQQSGPRLLRNLLADHLRTMLQTQVENGVVEIVQIGKAKGYRLL